MRNSSTYRDSRANIAKIACMLDCLIGRECILMKARRVSRDCISAKRRVRH
jgi:hypothetical protein